MAAVKHCPVVSKHNSIGVSMTLDDIAKENNYYPINLLRYYGYECKHENKVDLPRFRYKGYTFFVFMCNLEGVVSVTLIPESPLPSMTLSHSVSIVGGGHRLDGDRHKIMWKGAVDDDVEESDDDSDESVVEGKGGEKMSARVDKYGCRIDVISWADLKSTYSTDGVFDVEFDFSPSKTVPFLPIPLDPSICDFSIGLASDPKFSLKCYRNILMVASKVFHGILSNEKSKESIEKRLVIGAEFATPKIVELFVLSMTKGWTKQMNEYPQEILRLADMYNCPAIAVVAVSSLKRQLTDRTFWSIARLAFLLDVGQPALLGVIVDFVFTKPARTFELLGRKDQQTAAEISRLTQEVFARHQKALSTADTLGKASTADTAGTVTDKSEVKTSGKSEVKEKSRKSARYLVNEPVVTPPKEKSIVEYQTESSSGASEAEESTEFEKE